jgi:hypothetical protein
MDKDSEHGTQQGYRAGCREACCKDAHAAYMRAYRQPRDETPAKQAAAVLTKARSERVYRGWDLTEFVGGRAIGYVIRTEPEAGVCIRGTSRGLVSAAERWAKAQRLSCKSAKCPHCALVYVQDRVITCHEAWADTSWVGRSEFDTYEDWRQSTRGRNLRRDSKPEGGHYWIRLGNTGRVAVFAPYEGEPLDEWAADLTRALLEAPADLPPGVTGRCGGISQRRGKKAESGTEVFMVPRRVDVAEIAARLQAWIGRELAVERPGAGTAVSLLVEDLTDPELDAARTAMSDWAEEVEARRAAVRAAVAMYV